MINVNSYDVILGTPFLWQHQVMVGFNPARVIVGSKTSLPIEQHAETRPAVNALDFEDAEMAHARGELLAYAEPLCKSVEETELPPLRAINHTIPLINENAVYHWRRSTCPEKFRGQWKEKYNTYLASGRWEATTATNAIPMLLIPKPKKDVPELRTV